MNMAKKKTGTGTGTGLMGTPVGPIGGLALPMTRPTPSAQAQAQAQAIKAALVPSREDREYERAERQPAPLEPKAEPKAEPSQAPSQVAPSIRIETVGDQLVVTLPATERVKLWAVMRLLYPGQTAQGPKGPFTIPPLG